MTNENENQENPNAGAAQTEAEHDADPALGGLPAGARPLGLLVEDAVVGLDGEFEEKLLVLAQKWRDSGSRYRTQCAYEMLELFGIELPDLPPPLENHVVDSHAKIPIGSLIAELDIRLMRLRTQIQERARRIGTRLVALASDVSQEVHFASGLPPVGDPGAFLDRLALEFITLKSHRDQLLRIAARERARARAERTARPRTDVPLGEQLSGNATASANEASWERAIHGAGDESPFED